MTKKRKGFISWACFLGFVGVLAGALGSHLLAERLTLNDLRAAWDTAVYMLMIHALVLLFWSSKLIYLKSSLGRWAARLWAVGIPLFSFSIFTLCLGGPRFFGPITPLGGLCLLAAWALAGFSVALAKDE